MSNIHRRGQAGVGLIEVLIALLVLSIGMLGLAGLQTWSLKNNQGSMERGMAVMQTHTIADAMRAARTLAINNGFNVGLDVATDNIDLPSPLATAALRTWRQSLEANLGEGATGGVACGGSASCSITIRWQDRSQPLTDDEAAEEEGEESPRTQELVTWVRL